nr:hypothetical protein [uncultured Sphaerochaeta sp.]
MNDRRNQYCKINVSGRNLSPKEAQDYVYNVQGYPREKTEEGFFEVKSSSYSERPAPTFTQETHGPAKKGQITITFANKVSTIRILRIVGNSIRIFLATPVQDLGLVYLRCSP